MPVACKILNKTKKDKPTATIETNIMNKRSVPFEWSEFGFFDELYDAPNTIMAIMK